MATGSSSDESSRHAHKMSKLDDFDFPYCRDATVTYEKLAKIGQGTFGLVTVLTLIFVVYTLQLQATNDWI